MKRRFLRALSAALCLVMLLTLAHASGEEISTIVFSAPVYDLNNTNEQIKVGETVTFGSYPQGAGGEIRPIEWTVLDIDEYGYYVLISNYALDAKPYKDENTDTTWETSSLREWLNGDFFDIAFNGEEQTKIKTTHLSNADNSVYGTPGGNDTDDKVYLLSLDEITQYYPGIEPENYGSRHDEITCKPTEYAKRKGAYTYSYDPNDQNGNEELAKYDGNCVWWLRSPGNGQSNASGVRGVGYINNNDYNVASASNAVRPVVRVRKPYAPGLTTDTREGDIVTFGSYPQDTNSAKEPIEWQVLAIDEEGYYVLISTAGLDLMPYNEEKAAVTWENCTLRAWLNDKFYRIAFDEEERERIKHTHLINGKNACYNIDGGKDTDDYVYLLSLDEIHEYYSVEDVYLYAHYAELLCKATGYAGNKAGYTDWCSWWLRSPGFIGDDRIQASTVDEFGNLNCYGSSVSSRGIAVRPVVRVEPAESMASAETGLPTEMSKGAAQESMAAETAAEPAEESAAAETTAETPEERAAEEMTDEPIAEQSGGYRIGSVVYFGSYPQGPNGEVEPIEWTVLDIDEDGCYVLISNYVLDAKAFNGEEVGITWQKCSLRIWLNGEFYNTAFTAEEQAAIKINQLPNSDNYKFGTSGGNSTVDRVYMLSLDEVTQYFGIQRDDYYNAYDELCCRPTEYAVANNVGIVDTEGNLVYIDSFSNSEWWLRSPGDYQYVAATIHYDGHVSPEGRKVARDCIGVRPVIRVKY